MESLYGERTDNPEESCLLSDAELALLGRALLASLESARVAPLLARHEHGIIIDRPEVIFALLAPEMSNLPQEQMRVLTLNTRHGLLGNHLIYQGTVSQAPVRAAEIFRPAVIQQAPAIIIAHNHPSGNPATSAEDRRVTERLVEAGRLLDIAIVDHVIIAGSTYTSCREQGLMPEMYSPPQQLSAPTGDEACDDSDAVPNARELTHLNAEGLTHPGCSETLTEEYRRPFLVSRRVVVSEELVGGPRACVVGLSMGQASVESAAAMVSRRPRVR